MKAVSSLCFTVLMSSCHPRVRLAEPAPPVPLERLSVCTEVASDTAGWRRVADLDFDFLLPPAYTELVVHAFDSHVRDFATPDGRGSIGLGYGLYSSSLEEYRSLRGFAECRADLGGRPARVVTGRSEDGRYLVAATWRDLPPGAHLTITGAAADAAGQREIASVLRTVKFRFR